MITWENFERDIYLSSPYDVYHLLFAALRERASIVGYVLRLSDAERLTYFAQEDLWNMLSVVHEVLPRFCQAETFEQQEKILPLTPVIGYPLIDSGDGLTVPLLADASGRRLYHKFDARLAITIYRLLRLMRYVPGLYKIPDKSGALTYRVVEDHREYMRAWLSRSYTTAQEWHSEPTLTYPDSLDEWCREVNENYTGLAVPRRVVLIDTNGFALVSDSYDGVSFMGKRKNSLAGMYINNECPVCCFFKYFIPSATATKTRKRSDSAAGVTTLVDKTEFEIPQYLSRTELLAPGESRFLLVEGDQYDIDPDDLSVYDDPERSIVNISETICYLAIKGGFERLDGYANEFTVADCVNSFSYHGGV